MGCRHGVYTGFLNSRRRGNEAQTLFPEPQALPAVVTLRSLRLNCAPRQSGWKSECDRPRSQQRAWKRPFPIFHWVLTFGHRCDRDFPFESKRTDRINFSASTCCWKITCCCPKVCFWLDVLTVHVKMNHYV